MSYNGSGTFVINSTGQPVVTGTVISSSTFNSLTADLGTGLSTAITKDGQTTTTAKIPFAQGLSAAVASNFAAGTVGAPSIYLLTDTTTGLYRIGANNDGFAVSGVKLLDISSAGLAVTGTLSASTGAAVGGATAGSGGLAFPATAVAVANANTLDDYEEGTWTPTYDPVGGGFTTITYNIQSGRYTKIGRVVYFDFNLRTASLTIGSATGSLRISGLPFTVSSNDQGTAMIGQAEAWGGDYPSGAFIRASSQLVSLLYRDLADGTTVSVDVGDMSTSASTNELSGGGFYII